MKKDIANLDDIKLFVNEFYARVQADDVLNPIFIGRNQGNWQPHLERMYLFWNAALFAKKGYVGNPFSKHLFLEIKDNHFEKWLSLFNQTIDTFFEGAVAEDAKWRANAMAQNFMQRLHGISLHGTKPIV